MRPFLLGSTTLANFAGTYTRNNQLIGNFLAGEIVLGFIPETSITVDDDLGDLDLGFDGTIVVGVAIVDDLGDLGLGFDGFINDVFITDNLGDLDLGFDGSAVFQSFVNDDLGDINFGFDGTVFTPLYITDDFGDLGLGFDGIVTLGAEYYRNAIIEFNEPVYLSATDDVQLEFSPTVIKLIEE